MWLWGLRPKPVVCIKDQQIRDASLLANELKTGGLRYLQLGVFLNKASVSNFININKVMFITLKLLHHG